MQLHRATKEGGEWSHTHQIAYRAISMEFILELMQGTDLLIGNWSDPLHKGFNALKDAFLMFSSFFIINYVIQPMNYTSLGNPAGTSPHSEDGTQGKPDSSWLKTVTTINTLRAQCVTCGNWSCVGRITLHCSTHLGYTQLTLNSCYVVSSLLPWQSYWSTLKICSDCMI